MLNNRLESSLPVLIPETVGLKSACRVCRHSALFWITKRAHYVKAGESPMQDSCKIKYLGLPFWNDR